MVKLCFGRLVLTFVRLWSALGGRSMCDVIPHIWPFLNLEAEQKDGVPSRSRQQKSVLCRAVCPTYRRRFVHFRVSSTFIAPLGTHMALDVSYFTLPQGLWMIF